MMTDPNLGVDIAVHETLWRSADGDVETKVSQVLRSALAEVLKAEAFGEKRTFEVSVVLADDNFVKSLNLKHRGQDKATNVLSFPSLENVFGDMAQTPADCPVALGDIVIAYETTALEAKDLGKTLAAHLCHLLVHGMLHLLGYDHKKPCEAERMEGLEKHILLALGEADPYEDGN
jgi:probable rRNA maturation factor